MALNRKDVIEVLERLIVSAETTKMNIESLAVAVRAFELVTNTMTPYAPALAPLQAGIKIAISLFGKSSKVIASSLQQLADAAKSELARRRQNNPPDECPGGKN